MTSCSVFKPFSPVIQLSNPDTPHSDSINGSKLPHEHGGGGGETDSSDEEEQPFNNHHNMLCPPEMTRIFKNEPIDPIEPDQKRIRYT